ncbi:MAG: TetR/AcrR family transcriptional regulator [Candidatus Cloacimonetes bacterium]|nr:TetR/AcrR family transcriptional regulator [Candidatus Cloacimonadota bacterium]
MERREEILNAAEAAFIRYGIYKTTLEDIARECGISKTALYYYFKSKNDLISSMLSHKLQSMQEKVRNAVAEGSTVRDRLRNFILQKIENIMDNKPFWNLFNNEELPLRGREFIAIKRQNILDFDFSTVEKILKEGITVGVIRVRPLHSLILMILGVTYGCVYGKLFENTNWDIYEMIEDSLNVIFKAIEVKQEN